MQQTGYALTLFGRLDIAKGDTEAAARRIYERLRTLALMALASLPVQPLLQVQPFGRAVIRPDPRSTVDVELSVIASPPHPEHTLAPTDARQLVAALEAKLCSMGLKKRT